MTRNLDRTESNSGDRSSLRDRARILQRNAVLDAACDLFLEHGYRATTIAAIASAAGVGVATVFRYFRSKEGVLAALSRRDIDETLERARAVAAEPSEEPATLLLAVFDEILKMHRMPSTRIRGQTRIWLLIRTGHPATDEVVTSSDNELREIIRDLLLRYRQRGVIEASLSLRDMAEIIFAVFYHHYLAIALDRDTRMTSVARTLRRRIPMLFESWRVREK